MKKHQLIKTDDSKKIYKSEKEDQYIIEFLDEDPFKKSKKEKIQSRGICNNGISSLIFEYLESYHVPTYFVKKIDAKEMLVKKCEPIPIKVIVRNIAWDDLCKIYGFPEGKVLDSPIIEYYIKDEKLNNPLANEYHISALNYATIEEIKTISKISSKINAILKSFFKRRTLKLVDIQLEFGKHSNKIVVCDEITPETCKLWDDHSDEKYDLDTIKKKSDSAETIYKTLMEKINVVK